MVFSRRIFLASVLAGLIFLYLPLHAARFDPGDRADYLAAVDGISVEDIRSTILKIWGHGLNPKTYWTDSMEKTYGARPSSKDLKNQANKSFLRLLQDVSVGNTDPESLSADIKISSKSFVSSKQLAAIALKNGYQADLVVESLAPQNPPYLALKASIVRLYPACKYGTWLPIKKFKKTLRAGVRDPSVVDIKKRFQLLGYPVSNLSDAVDDDFVNAVNDIEWTLRIDPDGTIHPDGRVWDFLSVSCLDRVRQLQVDMEKIRWFPQYFGERFILVNTAFSYFMLIDRSEGQNKMISYRTINGRFERKTPTMKDHVVRIIFNPYWVVPPTIFVEDKVQEIRTLPRSFIKQYFDERNYEVWNHDFTRRLEPDSIDWWNIDAELDQQVFIRQKPNYWNALGVVKFDLTNPYTIYLHDTNQRELFTQASRLLSSGCIRLERPLDVAEHLLRGTKWTREAITNIVAKPGQVMPRDTEINLEKPMPVYVIFLTAQLTSDNVLRFTSDTYGQNQEILAKFEPSL